MHDDTIKGMGRLGLMLVVGRGMQGPICQGTKSVQFDSLCPSILIREKTHLQQQADMACEHLIHTPTACCSFLAEMQGKIPGMRGRGCGRPGSGWHGAPCSGRVRVQRILRQAVLPPRSLPAVGPASLWTWTEAAALHLSVRTSD